MKTLLLALLKAYKTWISPLLPPACRYEPSCSRYAMAAIELYGPLRGSYLALRRILRCNPWGRSGYDPVPPLWTEVGQTSIESVIRPRTTTSEARSPQSSPHSDNGTVVQD
ncbi:MAG: membrane protein insertion efficiency factor YidD [Prochlorothrix sp.]